MDRLTNDEKRTIVKLYENNKSLTEIIQTTGRNRKTINKVLTDVGLYENGIRHKARLLAQYNTNNWNSLTLEQQNTIIYEHINKVKHQCKINYSLLFNTDDTVVDLSEYIKISDILDYCNEQVEIYTNLLDNNTEGMTKCTDKSKLSSYIIEDSFLHDQILKYKVELPAIIRKIKDRSK